MAKPKFLSVRETVERLQVPEKKIRRLVREGKLPVTRVGYHILVDERDVAKLAATK